MQVNFFTEEIKKKYDCKKDKNNFLNDVDIKKNNTNMILAIFISLVVGIILAIIITCIFFTI